MTVFGLNMFFRRSNTSTQDRRRKERGFKQDTANQYSRISKKEQGHSKDLITMTGNLKQTSLSPLLIILILHMMTTLLWTESIKSEVIVKNSGRQSTQINQTGATINNLRVSKLAINLNNHENVRPKSNNSGLQDGQPRKASNASNQQMEPKANISLQIVSANASKNSIAPADQQASASLLRPLILKGLMSARISSKLLNGGSGDEPQGEEEEEVTQTIMMPMSDKSEVPSSAASSTSEDERSSSSSSSGGDGDSDGESISTDKGESTSGGSLMSADDTPISLTTKSLKTSIESSESSSKLQHLDELPKADESLRLTSTEMNSLLNDREAPEFYKERERHGDGVLVREEQPVRLDKAASGGFGSHHMGHYMGGSDGMHPSSASFDGDHHVPHRLSHAASEGLGGGFSHRFGYADDLGHAGMNGRLMQSPNEFNEYHSHGHASTGHYEPGHAYGYGHEHSSGHGDYSGGSHSGLLRAGSGEFGHDHGYRGGYEGYQHDIHASGYMGPGSGRLEQHSSELYPGSHSFGSHHPGLDHMGSVPYGGGAGRLLSAGSHHPGGYSSGGHFSSDEYSSRYGHAGGFGDRGFATQNNGVMMRGNSMLSGTSTGSGSSVEEPSLGSGKLIPLSPIVPAPEEVSSSESVEKETSRAQRPQVDETLDDDGLQSNQNNNDNDNEDTSTNQASNEVGGSYGGGGNGNNPGDDNGASQSRVYKQESGGGGGGGGVGGSSSGGEGEHSLVLNVPPPSGDSSQAYRSSSHIEFARIGSAGYLPPILSSTSSSSSSSPSSTSASDNEEEDQQPVGRTRYKKLVKKSNAIDSGYHQAYDPAENPAHAGKYIID